MLPRGNRSALVAALALALGALTLGSPSQACSVSCGEQGLPGYSLADLVAGGTFDSLDGLLTFDGFSASTSGDAETDLDCYRVIPLDDGFRLLTPLGAILGAASALTLGYQVSGHAIAEAAISLFDGLANGEDHEAGATMPILDDEDTLLATLEVFDLGSTVGVDQTDDAVTFSTPVGPLRIVDEMVYVVSAAGGVYGVDFARATKVDHHFTVVPEPTALALMTCGLFGLGALGRRRSARRRRRSRPTLAGALR